MVGKTILHYKILDKLGEGEMCEVFKAQDTKLDCFVALRFLTSQLTASENDKARLKILYIKLNEQSERSYLRF